MTFNEWLQRLSTQGLPYSDSMRTGENDVLNMGALQAQFDQITALDSQGRPIYGTSATDRFNAGDWVGTAGTGTLGDPAQIQKDFPDWYAQLVSAFGAPTYDPAKGYQYPTGWDDEFKKFSASQKDIWSTLGDMGPLIAGGMLAAGPMAASMAAGAGTGAAAAGTGTGATAGTAGSAFPVTSTSSLFGPSTALSGAEMAGTFGSVPVSSQLGTLGLESFMPGGVLGGAGSFVNPGTAGAIENLVSGAGAAAPSAASTIPSFLKNLLPSSGDGKTDWSRLIGSLGGAALGAFGANQQVNANEEMFNKMFGAGAPARDLFYGTFAPGYDISKEPGYQQAIDTSTNSMLRGLSTQVGNPWDSPGAQAETMKHVMGSTALPYLMNTRNTLANAGGLGLSQSVPFGEGQIQSQGGIYDALGYGLNEAFNPKPDYTKQMLDMMKNWNFSGRI